MKIGDTIKVVNPSRSMSIGRLEHRIGTIVAVKAAAGGVRFSKPWFWLVELEPRPNDRLPTACKRLGGWAGIAIGGEFLKPIV